MLLRCDDYTTHFKLPVAQCMNRILLTNAMADHLVMMANILANSEELSIEKVCSKLMLEDGRQQRNSKTARAEVLLFSQDKEKASQWGSIRKGRHGSVSNARRWATLLPPIVAKQATTR